jgi:2-keto-4-pentenoate hydratase/2-oxohepta-3-ene-1,7-dioic acid hydratase in catechol pathway
VNQVIVKGQPVTPSKIVCVGRNYVEHIAELGNEVPDEMVVFIKPNSAISNTLYSFINETLHYETEIAFIVNDGEFSAVGVGLDLTKRTLQGKLKAKGLPWERAKAFTGAALFSEFVELPDDLSNLQVQLKIGGQLTQLGGVDLMMYKPADILQELISFLDLNDGDIVMTGTPKGVGEIKANVVFDAAILADDVVLVKKQWQAVAAT